MTNNPLKIEGLTAAGIEVAGRIPISVGEHTVNTDYLETKRVRMGHMLAEHRLVTALSGRRFGIDTATVGGHTLA